MELGVTEERAWDADANFFIYRREIRRSSVNIEISCFRICGKFKNTSSAKAKFTHDSKVKDTVNPLYFQCRLAYLLNASKV